MEKTTGPCPWAKCDSLTLQRFREKPGSLPAPGKCTTRHCGMDQDSNAAPEAPTTCIHVPDLVATARTASSARLLLCSTVQMLAPSPGETVHCGTLV